jgi:hypothetical protein
MHLLTDGLTTEGDTLLIGVAAVFLMIVLYPFVGVWSMLAFPAVLITAVVGRAALRKRRDKTPS